MREPPSNKNVPKSMWDRDNAAYNDYNSEYDLLVSHGLSDQEADLFIDSREKITSLMTELDPAYNEDFFIDNMDRHFDDAVITIGTMKTIFNKMTR
jgi:TFIIF-interacting CTD phosphatase-like protein